jgi:hypothetical protein
LDLQQEFLQGFCTLATWKDGKINEERLFYDQVGMLKQIGVTYIKSVMVALEIHIYIVISCNRLPAIGCSILLRYSSLGVNIN